MADLTFRKAELYGGAITANLPEKWLDASNIREIPSHQEVHLSITSSTNVVIEINQYVTPEESSYSPSGQDENGSSDLEDKAAVLYHLRDLIDPSDSLNIISSPQKVQLADPSLKSFPTWLVHGKVEVRTPIRGPPPPQTMESVLGSSEAAPSEQRFQISSTSIHLLLVRLKEKETDLCIIVNVPHVDLGDAEVAVEEQLAEKVMEGIVGSMKVEDWDLFL